MKSLKLKKLVAAALAVATISVVTSMGASAAWRNDSKGWWNTEGNSYSIGWRQLDGNWYHFDSVGYMKTGWVQDGESWYYMNPVSDGTKGSMKTGWIQDGRKWYYTNPVSDGTKGSMKTGWIQDNGKWYYMNPVSDGTKGSMQTGIVKVGGKVYCLQPSGSMATGNVEINGSKYTFSASGECIGDTPKVDKEFNSNGTVINQGSTNNQGSNSTNNNGNNSTDKGGSSSNSHTGSSSTSKSTHHAHNSGRGGEDIVLSTVPSINEFYADYAELEKVADNTYKFKKSPLKIADNSSDYVTRDIYVIGAEKVDKNGDTFIITPEKGQNTVVKGVVRVVRDGKISYVTSVVK